MKRDIDFTGSDKDRTFALFLPVIRYKAALTVTVSLLCDDNNC